VTSTRGVRRLGLARLALVLAVLSLVAGCGAPGGPGAASPAPGGAEAAVSIQNFAFEPAGLEVARGTLVTWTNRDSTAHTVTSGTNRSPDRKFASTPIAQNGTFSFTFGEAGTFEYYCDFHTRMTGLKIVVK
jgi:plastocyanin